MNNKYILEFKQKNGEVFLNSVFGGGAYTFLLNLSEIKPLIILDTRKHKGTFLYLYKSECNNIRVNHLSDLLNALGVVSISINHLIWSEDISTIIDMVVKLTIDSNIKVKFYLHDFYTVCPSINLLNYNKKYCNVPSPAACNTCLENYDNPVTTLTFNKKEIINNIPLHHFSIIEWRNLWHKLFAVTNYVVLPSEAAAKIWLKAFPEYESKVNILYHDLHYLNDIRPHLVEATAPFFQVYVIGDIGEHKGANIIDSVLELIQLHKLNICINVIGFYDNNKFNNTPFLKLHGRFTHNEIASILNSKEIHCFLMPSICPETFSFTTHEMMATKLPIIGFNLGAQGQFIGSYENGKLIRDVNAALMFKEVEKLYKNYRELLYPQLKFKLTPKESIEIEKLIRDYELLQLENKTFYLNYKTYKIEVEERLKKEIDIIKLEPSLFYNSLSWKLTKPLRKTMNFVRAVMRLMKETIK